MAANINLKLSKTINENKIFIKYMFENLMYLYLKKHNTHDYLRNLYFYIPRHFRLKIYARRFFASPYTNSLGNFQWDSFGKN